MRFYLLVFLLPPQMDPMIGSDEELQQRIDNYDEEVNQRRDKLKKAEAKHADVEDELQSTRGRQNDLTTKKGRLEAEAQVCGACAWSLTLSILLLNECYRLNETGLRAARLQYTR